MRQTLVVQLINEGLPIEVVMERAGFGEEEMAFLLLATFIMAAALSIIHHLPRKRRRKRGPPDVPGLKKCRPTTTSIKHFESNPKWMRMMRNTTSQRALRENTNILFLTFLQNVST
jgi:hypothetical protein